MDQLKNRRKLSGKWNDKLARHWRKLRANDASCDTPFTAISSICPCCPFVHHECAHRPRLNLWRANPLENQNIHRNTLSLRWVYEQRAEIKDNNDFQSTWNPSSVINQVLAFVLLYLFTDVYNQFEVIHRYVQPGLAYGFSSHWFTLQPPTASEMLRKRPLAHGPALQFHDKSLLDHKFL